MHAISMKRENYEANTSHEVAERYNFLDLQEKSYGQNRVLEGTLDSFCLFIIEEKRKSLYGRDLLILNMYEKKEKTTKN